MWNARVQRLIRSFALLAAALGLAAGTAWMVYTSPESVQSVSLKVQYTSLQFRAEAWPWSTWSLLFGGLLTSSLIGIPSGLQFLLLFPFLPPVKAWAVVVFAQTLTTWLVTWFTAPGKQPSRLPPELTAAVAEAGSPLRLAWALRVLLGIPNRTIDAALATACSPDTTARRLALWALPGHCLRAALTGAWVSAISLVILDFRPFPEYDLARAAVMTVVLSVFWLLPWIPELIPGGPAVHRLISICSGTPSTDPESSAEAPGSAIQRQTPAAR
ncbi:MAG TPA: hypothetical protein VIV61_16140 [Candidatus Ozemobacteraceae bacterium]